MAILGIYTGSIGRFLFSRLCFRWVLSVTKFESLVRELGLVVWYSRVVCFLYKRVYTLGTRFKLVFTAINSKNKLIDCSSQRTNGCGSNKKSACW